MRPLRARKPRAPSPKRETLDLNQVGTCPSACRPAANSLLTAEADDRTPLDALDLSLHLLNFFAPALGLGLLVPTLAKAVWRQGLAGTPWRTLAWQCAAVSALLLVAGLVITGHDGRMSTWGAVVLGCALVPWWQMTRR